MKNTPLSFSSKSCISVRIYLVWANFQTVHIVIYPIFFVKWSEGVGGFRENRYTKLEIDKKWTKASLRRNVFYIRVYDTAILFAKLDRRVVLHALFKRGNWQPLVRGTRHISSKLLFTELFCWLSVYFPFSSSQTVTACHRFSIQAHTHVIIVPCPLSYYGRLIDYSLSVVSVVSFLWLIK